MPSRPGASRDATPLLEVSGVGKSFGGERALDGVHLDLRPGEVHALMGENGAGKSTLMKVLAGVHQPDEGTVRVDGEPVAIHGPRAATELGIAIIHQELNTIPEMSVAENLALAHEPTRLGVVDRSAMLREATAKLERIGSSIDPRVRMGSLSVGQQQMVEIARAVAEDARVLILDEPTAALSDGESQRLFALIDEMRARGLGMIYISHRMEEVWRLADRITVLRDGRYVATSDRGELTPEQVVAQMIGRDVDALYVRDDHELGEPVLEVDGLEGADGIGPVSFSVRAGEVVGLVGLVGAGRTEIARLIAGVDRPVGGTVTIEGKRTRFRGPSDAIRGGVGFLPESRKEQALFADLSISDNIVMAALPRFSRLGPLRGGAIAKAVARQMKALRIRASSPRRPVSALSGGNQQKVVLGRWLTVGPRVLILDEPTRGVDIGAKAEIYRTINELAKDGVAILVVSSDLPEALGISDRVLVVRDGRVVRELGWEHATEEEVMLAATGVARGGDGPPREPQGLDVHAHETHDHETHGHETQGGAR